MGSNRSPLHETQKRKQQGLALALRKEDTLVETQISYAVYHTKYTLRAAGEIEMRAAVM